MSKTLEVPRASDIAGRTDDLRVESLRPLLPPAILFEEVPLSEHGQKAVRDARENISAVVRGTDPRLLVVVGPCSIHDSDAARDYAERLLKEADKHKDTLLVVMRTYFEKPRTTIGWKGLINDPNLDDSFQINQGLRVGRSLLRDLAEMGLPAGVEFLDPITPQYIADLVSWGAIGARTSESQVHRELTSGLSMPVGFKNATTGSIKIAVDAIRSSAHPHHFLGVTKQGLSAIVKTSGNPDCHLILRGSEKGPNYSAEDVEKSLKALEKAGLNRRLMIDCSHGNSSKDEKRQPIVARDVAEQIKKGSKGICGVMIESNLKAGKQSLTSKEDLVYGQSITDGCIGWDETEAVLKELAASVNV